MTYTLTERMDAGEYIELTRQQVGKKILRLFRGYNKQEMREFFEAYVRMLSHPSSPYKILTEEQRRGLVGEILDGACVQLDEEYSKTKPKIYLGEDKLGIPLEGVQRPIRQFYLESVIAASYINQKIQTFS